MKLKLEFDLPEDREEYTRTYFANEAWSAIDQALILIRNHQKHDYLTADDVIERVRDMLGEAWGRLE